MISFIEKKRSTLSYRILCSFIALTFAFSVIVPPTPIYAQALPQSILNLPLPGTMVPVSTQYIPALIKGITLYPDNPLMFDFIVDSGNSDKSGDELNKEAEKLIKYFLATLTTPEDQLWVNLSPYEKNRIIPDGLGQTEMGRDLLAQDYLLKQITASMMYPEEDLGKKFWDRVYKQAKEQYGTTEIPMNTFNKIWIVPEKATVYEHESTAYVIGSHLKVMLEEDYVAMDFHQKSRPKSRLSSEAEHERNSAKEGAPARDEVFSKKDAEVISGISSEVVRNILIPELEKEVNEGKNFAQLRQVYHSMILATWFKQNLKNSLLGQVYVDQNKTKGIDVKDKQINQKIYDQYIESFKKGVYNYIREDIDLLTNEVMPRKYFSGGKHFGRLRSILGVVTLSALMAFSAPNFAEARGHLTETGKTNIFTTAVVEATDEVVTYKKENKPIAIAQTQEMQKDSQERSFESLELQELEEDVVAQSSLPTIPSKTIPVAPCVGPECPANNEGARVRGQGSGAQVVEIPKAPQELESRASSAVGKKQGASLPAIIDGVVQRIGDSGIVTEKFSVEILEEETDSPQAVENLLQTVFLRLDNARSELHQSASSPVTYQLSKDFLPHARFISNQGTEALSVSDLQTVDPQHPKTRVEILTFLGKLQRAGIVTFTLEKGWHVKREAQEKLNELIDQGQIKISPKKGQHVKRKAQEKPKKPIDQGRIEISYTDVLRELFRIVPDDEIITGRRIARSVLEDVARQFDNPEVNASVIGAIFHKNGHRFYHGTQSVFLNETIHRPIASSPVSEKDIRISSPIAQPVVLDHNKKLETWRDLPDEAFHFGKYDKYFSNTYNYFRLYGDRNAGYEDVRQLADYMDKATIQIGQTESGYYDIDRNAGSVTIDAGFLEFLNGGDKDSRKGRSNGSNGRKKLVNALFATALMDLNGRSVSERVKMQKLLNGAKHSLFTPIRKLSQLRDMKKLYAVQKKIERNDTPRGANNRYFLTIEDVELVISDLLHRNKVLDERYLRETLKLQYGYYGMKVQQDGTLVDIDSEQSQKLLADFYGKYSDILIQETRQEESSLEKLKERIEPTTRIKGIEDADSDQTRVITQYRLTVDYIKDPAFNGRAFLWDVEVDVLDAGIIGGKSANTGSMQGAEYATTTPSFFFNGDFFQDILRSNDIDSFRQRVSDRISALQGFLDEHKGILGVSVNDFKRDHWDETVEANFLGVILDELEKGSALEQVQDTLEGLMRVQGDLTESGDSYTTLQDYFVALNQRYSHAFDLKKKAEAIKFEINKLKAREDESDSETIADLQQQQTQLESEYDSLLQEASLKMMAANQIMDIPSAYKQEMVHYLKTMAERLGIPVEELNMGLRSSAAEEDGPFASFAGRLSSYFNISVQKRPDLLKKYDFARGELDEEGFWMFSRQWTFNLASKYTQRSIVYAHNVTGQPIFTVEDKISTVFQDMVETENPDEEPAVALTVFSVDQGTGFPTIKIQMTEGQGDIQVAGVGDGDTAFYSYDGNKLTHLRGDRSKMFVNTKDHVGRVMVEIPENIRQGFVLNDEDVLRMVVEYFRKQQEFYGPFGYMDFEGALVRKNGKWKIVSLQARPETVASLRDPDIIDQQRLEVTDEAVAAARKAGKMAHVKFLASTGSAAQGEIKWVLNSKKRGAFAGLDGKGLFMEQSDPDAEEGMARARFTLAARGGELSHTMVVSEENGDSAMSGITDEQGNPISVERLMEMFPDGTKMTIDPERGVLLLGYNHEMQLAGQNIDIKELEAAHSRDYLPEGYEYEDGWHSSQVPSLALISASRKQAFKMSPTARSSHVKGVGLQRLEITLASMGTHMNSLLAYDNMIRKEKGEYDESKHGTPMLYRSDRFTSEVIAQYQNLQRQREGLPLEGSAGILEDDDLIHTLDAYENLINKEKGEDVEETNILDRKTDEKLVNEIYYAYLIKTIEDYTRSYGSGEAYYKALITQSILAQAEAVIPPKIDLVIRAQQIKDAKLRLQVLEIIDQAYERGFGDERAVKQLGKIFNSLTGKHKNLYLVGSDADIVLHIKKLIDKFLRVRLPDEKSDEYDGYAGSELWINKEENPMMGERGLEMLLRTPASFRWVLEAIKDAAEKNIVRLEIFAPVVRHPEHVERWLKMMDEVGLTRDVIARGIMTEIGTNVDNIDDFLRTGIDFISTGNNDLTQAQGVDRNTQDKHLVNAVNGWSVEVVRSNAIMAAAVARENERRRKTYENQCASGNCGQEPSLKGSEAYAPMIGYFGTGSIAVVPSGFLRASRSLSADKMDPIQEERYQRFKSLKGLKLDIDPAIATDYAQNIDHDQINISDIRLSMGVHHSALRYYDEIMPAIRGGRFDEGSEDYKLYLQVYEKLEAAGENPLEDGIGMKYYKTIMGREISNAINLAKAEERQLVIGTDDATSTRYRQLIGGQRFVEKEANPAFGVSGINRFLYNDRYFSEIDLEIIKELVAENPDRMQIALKKVRGTKQLDESLAFIREQGLTIPVGVDIQFQGNLRILQEITENEGVSFVEITDPEWLTSQMSFKELDNPNGLETTDEDVLYHLRRPVAEIATAAARVNKPFWIHASIEGLSSLPPSSYVSTYKPLKAASSPVTAVLNPHSSISYVASDLVDWNDGVITIQLDRKNLANVVTIRRDNGEIVTIASDFTRETLGNLTHLFSQDGKRQTTDDSSPKRLEVSFDRENGLIDIHNLTNRKIYVKATASSPVEDVKIDGELSQASFESVGLNARLISIASKITTASLQMRRVFQDKSISGKENAIVDHLIREIGKIDDVREINVSGEKDSRFTADEGKYKVTIIQDDYDLERKSSLGVGTLLGIYENENLIGSMFILDGPITVLAITDGTNFAHYAYNGTEFKTREDKALEVNLGTPTHDSKSPAALEGTYSQWFKLFQEYYWENNRRGVPGSSGKKLKPRFSAIQGEDGLQHGALVANLYQILIKNGFFTEFMTLEEAQIISLFAEASGGQAIIMTEDGPKAPGDISKDKSTAVQVFLGNNDVVSNLGTYLEERKTSYEAREITLPQPPTLKDSSGRSDEINTDSTNELGSYLKDTMPTMDEREDIIGALKAVATAARKVGPMYITGSRATGTTDSGGADELKIDEETDALFMEALKDWVKKYYSEDNGFVTGFEGRREKLMAMIDSLDGSSMVAANGASGTILALRRSSDAPIEEQSGKEILASMIISHNITPKIMIAIEGMGVHEFILDGNNFYHSREIDFNAVRVDPEKGIRYALGGDPAQWPQGLPSFVDTLVTREGNINGYSGAFVTDIIGVINHIMDGGRGFFSYPVNKLRIKSELQTVAHLIKVAGGANLTWTHTNGEKAERIRDLLDVSLTPEPNTTKQQKGPSALGDIKTIQAIQNTLASSPVHIKRWVQGLFQPTVKKIRKKALKHINSTINNIISNDPYQWILRIVLLKEIAELKRFPGEDIEEKAGELKIILETIVRKLTFDRRLTDNIQISPSNLSDTKELQEELHELISQLRELDSKAKGKSEAAFRPNVASFPATNPVTEFEFAYRDNLTGKLYILTFDPKGVLVEGDIGARRQEGVQMINIPAKRFALPGQGVTTTEVFEKGSTVMVAWEKVPGNAIPHAQERVRKSKTLMPVSSSPLNFEALISKEYRDMGEEFSRLFDQEQLAALKDQVWVIRGAGFVGGFMMELMLWAGAKLIVTEGRQSTIDQKTEQFQSFVDQNRLHFIQEEEISKGVFTHKFAEVFEHMSEEDRKRMGITGIDGIIAVANGHSLMLEYRELYQKYKDKYGLKYFVPVENDPLDSKDTDAAIQMMHEIGIHTLNDFVPNQAGVIAVAEGIIKGVKITYDSIANQIMSQVSQYFNRARKEGRAFEKVAIDEADKLVEKWRIVEKMETLGESQEDIAQLRRDNQIGEDELIPLNVLLSNTDRALKNPKILDGIKVELKDGKLFINNTEVEKGTLLVEQILQTVDSEFHVPFDESRDFVRYIKVRAYREDFSDQDAEVQSAYDSQYAVFQHIDPSTGRFHALGVDTLTYMKSGIEAFNGLPGSLGGTKYGVTKVDEEILRFALTLPKIMSRKSATGNSEFGGHKTLDDASDGIDPDPRSTKNTSQQVDTRRHDLIEAAIMHSVVQTLLGAAIFLAEDQNVIKEDNDLRGQFALAAPFIQRQLDVEGGKNPSSYTGVGGFAAVVSLVNAHQAAAIDDPIVSPEEIAALLGRPSSKNRKGTDSSSPPIEDKELDVATAARILNMEGVNQEIVDAVINIIERGLNLDKGWIDSLDLDLIDDLRANDVDIVRFTNVLEQQFNIEIPDQEIDSFQTVRDVIRAVSDQLSASSPVPVERTTTHHNREGYLIGRSVYQGNESGRTDHYSAGDRFIGHSINRESEPSRTEYYDKNSRLIGYSIDQEGKDGETEHYDNEGHLIGRSINRDDTHGRTDHHDNNSAFIGYSNLLDNQENFTLFRATAIFPLLAGYDITDRLDRLAEVLGITREEAELLAGTNTEDILKVKMEIIREAGIEKADKLKALHKLRPFNLNILIEIVATFKKHGKKVIIEKVTRVYRQLNRAVRNETGQTAVQILKEKEENMKNILAPIIEQLVTASSPVIDQHSPSAASLQATSDEQRVGGINLNPALLDLQIKRDDNGIPLPFNLQPAEVMNIEGFIPVIINVTPIVNLPLLLGFDLPNTNDKPYDSADSETSPSTEIGFVDKYRKRYIREYEYI